MIKEAIILAGGFGTRLKEAVPDLPKPMAPVAGYPFLTHVIRFLLSKGIEHFIFSLGYKHEIIEAFLANKFPHIQFTCVIEDQPLGTGGAIRKALDSATEHDVLIVNGDTLFKADLNQMKEKHIEEQSECTIALKSMREFDRYGIVAIEADGRIKRFTEKKFVKEGNINGGIYLLNRIEFQKHDFPKIFSFEKDYLEKYIDQISFYGIVQDAYFIDIGIPADFEKAQSELSTPAMKPEKVDASWTLFLDRDGVINKNKDASYVFHRGEFEFLPGVPEAISRLSEVFGKLIVVTNQRGIGKGLMDEHALNEIHQHMIDELTKAGGRIDDLYYCAINDDKHHDRKPNPGMLLEAAMMHPEIDFSKSIMVGDKMSDMELGRNVGAFTVMIHTGDLMKYQDHPDVNLAFHSLRDFAETFRQQV